jgi:hypothetical protein
VESMVIGEPRSGFPLEEAGAPLFRSKGRMRLVAWRSHTAIALSADLECIGSAVSTVGYRAY